MEIDMKLPQKDDKDKRRRYNVTQPGPQLAVLGQSYYSYHCLPAQQDGCSI
jgi:hypothetical protein